MSTAEKIDRLGATLFGKTRRAVLALLYSHPDESFYLRQIARVTGAGMGSLQRELKQLSEAGIIQRSEIGRQAFFKANSDSPVFSELRNLIIKTFGVADVLRAALSPLANTIKEYKTTITTLNDAVDKWKRKYEFLAADAPYGYDSAGEK